MGKGTGICERAAFAIKGAELELEVHELPLNYNSGLEIVVHQLEDAYGEEETAAYLKKLVKAGEIEEVIEYTRTSQGDNLAAGSTTSYFLSAQNLYKQAQILRAAFTEDELELAKRYQEDYIFGMDSDTAIAKKLNWKLD